MLLSVRDFLRILLQTVLKLTKIIKLIKSRSNHAVAPQPTQRSTTASLSHLIEKYGVCSYAFIYYGGRLRIKSIDLYRPH